jgi:hypothetical protein
MDVFLAGVRERARTLMKAGPLQGAGWWCRSSIRVFVDPVFRRRELRLWRESRRWSRLHGNLLGPRLVSKSGETPRALIVGKETINGAKIELGLIKGLEVAGYEPVVLADRSFAKLYRVAGVTDFVHWEDFTDTLDRRAAEAAVASFKSVNDLLAFNHAGARVGRFAASSAFRFLRVGHLDLTDRATRDVVIEHLALGMTRARAAQRIIERVRPGVALFLGNRYTGQGELMDRCIAENVEVLTWFEAHRSNTLMLKRYNRGNTDQHHGSLSEKSWELLQHIEWTDERRRELRHEIAHNYANGDWYCRGGTQFGRRIVDGSEIRARLGLDPRRKTAIVFSHIIWDATLFWGRDLFDNYEEWLIETLRAACRNTSVNWVVKLHPAYLVKNAWEQFEGEATELTAIRDAIGALPPHVVIMPPETDVNTFSLFEVMDYCVTVRGTIGVEAAVFGKTVITAGTGRYDHKGFTFDSETRDEYLDRLAHVADLPEPTTAQRELAERFAYGMFILRPLSLKFMSIEYDRDAEATMRIGLHARSADDLRHAPDIRAFAEWVRNSADEDFLSPVATAAAGCA